MSVLAVKNVSSDESFSLEEIEVFIGNNIGQNQGLLDSLEAVVTKSHNKCTKVRNNIVGGNTFW